MTVTGTCTPANATLYVMFEDQLGNNPNNPGNPPQTNVVNAAGGRWNTTFAVNNLPNQTYPSGTAFILEAWLSTGNASCTTQVTITN